MTNTPIEAWIKRCLREARPHLIHSKDTSGGSGCQVWNCEIEVSGQHMSAVLKIYGEDFEDYSQIGVRDTLRKNTYALQELPKFSVPTVSILGYAEGEETAAILLEQIHAQEWKPKTRVEAAYTLSNLHDVSLGKLHPDFISLIRRSTPNRQRVFLSLEMADELDRRASTWREKYPDLSNQINLLRERGEPTSDLQTLVHGDFFSANILLGKNGLSVIDWDLLSLGDPMWDVGFLIGADRDITTQEIDETIAAYKEVRPIDMDVLMWHKQCWDVSWQLRKLRKQLL